MSHQMGGYERFQSPGFNHMQHPAFMNTVPPGTQPQMNPNFRKWGKNFVVNFSCLKKN